MADWIRPRDGDELPLGGLASETLSESILPRTVSGPLNCDRRHGRPEHYLLHLGLEAAMSFPYLIADSKRLLGGRKPIFLPVSYTHLRAHETPEHLVCRLLLE